MENLEQEHTANIFLLIVKSETYESFLKQKSAKYHYKEFSIHTDPTPWLVRQSFIFQY